MQLASVEICNNFIVHDLKSNDIAGAIGRRMFHFNEKTKKVVDVINNRYTALKQGNQTYVGLFLPVRLQTSIMKCLQRPVTF